MLYKDVVVQLDTAASLVRRQIAAEIAGRAGGHLTGVYLKTTLINQYNNIGCIGYLPPADLDALIRQNDQAQDEAAAKAEAGLAKVAAEAGVACDWRVIGGDAPDDLVALARRADLMVLPRPSPSPDYDVHASAVDVALGVSAGLEQRLQLDVLDVDGHGGRAVGAHEARDAADGVHGLARHGDGVDLEALAQRDAERSLRDGEGQRIGVLEEDDEAPALARPARGQARRREQRVHVAVAVRLRLDGEAAGVLLKRHVRVVVDERVNFFLLDEHDLARSHAKVVVRCQELRGA